MAKDQRKRQQKLERRTAKRREKRHELVRVKSMGLAQRLAAAAKFPIVDCWVAETCFTDGLGQALVSRQLPDGMIAVAIFLVDRYCLGVKNVLVDIVNRFNYDERITSGMRSKFEARDVAPEYVRKLVESSVAYARELGFPPYADYQKAKLIFGDIDATACAEEFEFGKDGKPLFISGPRDSPLRCRQILNTLTRTRGPGAFDYVIQMRASDQMLFDAPDPESIEMVED
jgi:hypothetical protein